jgi:tetratricopeptide (TPR) repeat protein
VITSLHGLADLYKAQHKFEAAEQQLERALRIREQTIEKFFAENAPRSTSGRLTPEQVRVAQTLAEIAELYSVQGKQTEAETLYDRSLKLCEQVVGPDHLENVKILESYARFLNQSKRDEQAKSLYARVVKIREKSFLAS